MARLTAAPAPVSARTTARTPAWRRILGGVLVCLPPVLLGLYVGATTFPGGTLVPWHPVMVDLDVYRLAGAYVLRGADFYALPGQLQFLYPPFAALLAAPLAALPLTLVQVAWTVAGVLALVAVIHRYGLRGWPLCLVSTACVYVVEPVSQTLAFGQLGIVLVALVVLDLAPGPRVLRRRIFPEGTWVAVATVVKLTPAIFVLYLIAVRRWRATIAATAVGIGLTLAAFAVLPGPSADFWGRLAHGDTGLGHSIIYYTNQSVLADVVRVLRLAPYAAPVGLALSAVVALLGVWAGAVWHQRGETRFAIALCGLAGLLASPVSWLHHFVWIVPLGIVLVELARRRAVPLWLAALGWAVVGWVLVSPYRSLPNGADVELDWTLGQHALASVTAVLGTALLVAAVAVGRSSQSTRIAARQAPANSGRPSTTSPGERFQSPR